MAVDSKFDYMLTICMNRHIVVKLSDLAKIWHFANPIIANISIPPPLDPKNLNKQRIF